MYHTFEDELPDGHTIHARRATQLTPRHPQITDKTKGNGLAEAVRAPAWMNSAIRNVEHDISTTIVDRTSMERGADRRQVIILGKKSRHSLLANDIVASISCVELNKHATLGHGPHKLSDCR